LERCQFKEGKVCPNYKTLTHSLTQTCGHTHSVRILQWVKIKMLCKNVNHSAELLILQVCQNYLQVSSWWLQRHDTRTFKVSMHRANWLVLMVLEQNIYMNRNVSHKKSSLKLFIIFSNRVTSGMICRRQVAFKHQITLRYENWLNILSYQNFAFIISCSKTSVDLPQRKNGKASLFYVTEILTSYLKSKKQSYNLSVL
jgi:hypothetical protein